MAELKTNPATGLSQAVIAGLLQQYGYNEIENKRHPLHNFFSKFWGLAAWMLEFIVVLSVFLHNLSDAYVCRRFELLKFVLFKNGKWICPNL